ncbi:MAG: hypothetical protein ACR2IE_03990 [Candidatus Sumerlaeaceae bacterium]
MKLGISMAALLVCLSGLAAAQQGQTATEKAKQERIVKHQARIKETIKIHRIAQEARKQSGLPQKGGGLPDMVQPANFDRYLGSELEKVKVPEATITELREINKQLYHLAVDDAGTTNGDPLSKIAELLVKRESLLPPAQWEAAGAGYRQRMEELKARGPQQATSATLPRQ